MSVDYELIFVEDRGVDGSWDVLAQLAAGDPHLRAFRLSRNFGQHMAITAGLAQARERGSSSWTATSRTRRRKSPASTRRRARATTSSSPAGSSASRPRACCAHAGRAYFRLLNLVAGTDIDRTYGTFSIIARKVADAYLEFRDRDRHLPVHPLLARVQPDVDRLPGGAAPLGRELLPGRRPPAPRGRRADFQTTVVLRWIVYAGFALAAGGGLLACYFVAAHVTGSSPPGWTSLATLLLLLTGFVIASSGVVGLYVGTTFEQVKQRPLYVIAETVGDDALVPETLR